MDLTVVIPAFNEAESIRGVLERLCERLQSIEELRGSFEVLVVDDGSTDGTGEIARRAGSLVTLVRHPYNLGNGAAVKTGIRNARGRVCLFMDADGQHDPESINQIGRAHV